MEERRRCLATTKQGKRCKRFALEGTSYCPIHSDFLDKDGFLPVRRYLHRQEILKMLAEHGSSQGLDLSYTDISGVKLGLNATPMLDLNGVVFGKYGDVRSGVIAEQTMFQRTRLRCAKFTYAKLRNANFYKADLTEADLRFSDLSRAVLVDTVLMGANLFSALLQDANLLNADLRQADLYLARFSGKTNLRRESIGERILQEDLCAYKAFIERAILPDSQNDTEHHLEDRFLKAKRVYESLRLHFIENGYLSDATWAYLRERRMSKLWAGQQAKAAWQQKHRWKGIKLLVKWTSDWIVELLCDYGESAWRVIAWMLAILFVIGPTLITLLGGLNWTGHNQAVYLNLNRSWQRWSYAYLQYLLYMIDTLTTANFAELVPRTDAVRLLSGFMSMIGIFLTGLLGFVAGNRIRNP